MTDNTRAQECTHIPVMLNEIQEALNIKIHGQYADLTYGVGGYSRAIASASQNKVQASDRDLAAVKIGANDPNVIMQHARFSDLQFAPESLDGIVADLGLSTPQISQDDRGFSFMRSGPLDMRMGLCTKSALELIESSSEAQLAEILWKYGEEPRSRSIAKAIKATRLSSTLELVKLVSQLTYHKGRNPATRTFQALRIAVNNELHELEYLLCNANTWLKPNGRLVIVAFHSLEDRMVKYHLKSWKATKRMLPSEGEIQQNPSSRSAKLRWGEK